jgi:hypothetical protein
VTRRSHVKRGTLPRQRKRRNFQPTVSVEISMTLRKEAIAMAAAVLVSLAMSAPARASGFQVLYDCMDDEQLSRTYSQKDYAEALASIPTDSDEYADCRRVVQRAALAAAAGDRKGATGHFQGQAGAPGVTSLDRLLPEDQAAAERAAAGGRATVRKQGAGGLLGGNVAEGSALPGFGPSWLPRPASAMPIGRHPLPLPIAIVEGLLALALAIFAGLRAGRLLTRRRPAG